MAHPAKAPGLKGSGALTARDHRILAMLEISRGQMPSIIFILEQYTVLGRACKQAGKAVVGHDFVP